jgi:hypothetical protein
VRAVLAEVIPNPAAAVAVAAASLPEVLVAAFGSRAVVWMGPGMAGAVLAVVVPSRED